MFGYGRRVYESWRRVNQSLRIDEFAWEVVHVLSIFHVITHYGINGTLCVGPSMMPTLREEGDLVLIDRFSSNLFQKRYQKDDVVICICPYDPKKTICAFLATYF